MSKPLVSIVIPAYNHQNYIDDCVRSILDQDYTNIEVIALDDGSSDRTFELLCGWKEHLEERFQRVVILKNESNMGVTKTLNKLLKMAEGKYIRELASDDFLVPDSISRSVEFYESHPECGMIYANGYIGSDEKHYPLTELELKNLKKCYEQVPNSGDIFQELYSGDFIVSPTVMLKRSVLITIGGYDEASKAEDWELYLRIAHSYKIGYLDYPVVFYRVSPESFSHSPSLEKRMAMCSSELYVLKKYAIYAGNRSEELIKNKANQIFREAFNMRSHQYMKWIMNYMSAEMISKKGMNWCIYILYRFHVFDPWFH